MGKVILINFAISINQNFSFEGRLFFMDYAVPRRRKNKNDRRAKSRFNKFKHGGRFRTSNIPMSEEKKQ